MNIPPDADEAHYGLGKKVEPIPVGEATEDEYEAVHTASGRLWRNKRTKQLSTDKPESWKAVADAIDRMRRQQEEDGYPNIFWGCM